MLSVSSSETARNYHYNRYPNQRFIYTLGPNIYAGVFVSFMAFFNSFIYLICDWRNCCTQCAEDEDDDEDIEQIENHPYGQYQTITKNSILEPQPFV